MTRTVNSLAVHRKSWNCCFARVSSCLTVPGIWIRCSVLRRRESAKWTSIDICCYITAIHSGLLRVWARGEAGTMVMLMVRYGGRAHCSTNQVWKLLNAYFWGHLWNYDKYPTLSHLIQSMFIISPSWFVINLSTATKMHQQQQQKYIFLGWRKIIHGFNFGWNWKTGQENFAPFSHITWGPN